MTESAVLRSSLARVLIVDDDPLAIEVLAEALGSDYEVRFATTGAQALQMIESAVPELLLLDMLLPDTDGYALYARLKQMPATGDLPVIFVTSVRDPVSEAKGLEMGAADYITKPISPPIVRARVHNHIELARARADLVSSRNEALAASRAKAAFLATMSHEIRTPLNGVIGMAQLLQLTKLDTEQRSFVDTILLSGDALLALVDDVLDFSKIESGRMDLESEPLELTQLVEETHEMLGGRVREKDLELVYAIAPDVPQTIYGDATRLRQVFINLVGNGIKFTKGGEVSTEIRLLKGGADGAAAMLEVCVRDTGVGIAPDRVGALFVPFTQADSSTTRTYGGTGLGLAICRRLVEAMGGEIGVESTLGQGSTFRFTLPVRQAPDKTPASESSAAGALAGRRVLVVDDNAASRQFITRQLEALGVVVVTADGGAAALEQIRGQARCDAAIIDERMAPMDGETLASRIQMTGADLPLVLLATTYPPAVSTGARFCARISKPLRHAQLRDAIMTTLGAAAVQRSYPRDMPLDSALAAKFPLHLLVVDDNAVNRKVAEATLARFGYRPLFAENGREAVDSVDQAAAAGKPFDIIFMDVQMPVMDGLDATRLIKRAGKSASPVVIAMTAAASPEDRTKCLQAGMDDYTTKPVNARDLQATIANWAARLRATSGG